MGRSRAPTQRAALERPAQRRFAQYLQKATWKKEQIFLFPSSGSIQMSVDGSIQLSGIVCFNHLGDLERVLL